MSATSLAPLWLLPGLICDERIWAPQVAAQIRGATLAIFDLAGHMAPVEAPERVTAAPRQWLAL